MRIETFLSYRCVLYFLFVLLAGIGIVLSCVCVCVCVCMCVCVFVVSLAYMLTATLVIPPAHIHVVTPLLSLCLPI
jgi:hypothetical protein